MSHTLKVLLCVTSALVGAKDTCLGDTQCCEKRTKQFTPSSCEATPNCKWSNGDNGPRDVEGCWYHGDNCFSCMPGNRTQSPCSGSTYCSERCSSLIPRFPLGGQARCVENFPAAQKQDGKCLASACCGGVDGGVATKETPDTCLSAEYCKWYNGSQPDGVRGCIYNGPLCVFCQVPQDAAANSKVGQPCSPSTDGSNTEFCTTHCATARVGPLPMSGHMVCRNVASQTKEAILV